MLALALVLDGRTRTEAAALRGMDRQTLRDWVHRYNELGLPGLSDRTPPGARRRLSAEQEAELADLVRQGPSIAEHGVVRWRGIDLSHVIRARFGVRLAERGVGQVLRRLGFRRLLVAAAIPQDARAKPIELWWQDDARVGQQGTLTRLWAERGSRPPAPRWSCRTRMPRR